MLEDAGCKFKLNFDEGGAQNSKKSYDHHGVIGNIFLGTYADIIEFP
jgi:hypothetical protein